MTLDEFVEADFEEGLYELARGAVRVDEIPDLEHGRIVGRVVRTFVFHDQEHPGRINYLGGKATCRVRLPGMQCSRAPDQAVYLLPPPPGDHPWTRWVPQIVVEVVSAGGEERDYVEKREEYLRIGVIEYWILDPLTRKLLVLRRAGDVWEEVTVPAGGTHRTHLLPGLEIRVDEWLGAAAET